MAQIYVDEETKKKLDKLAEKEHRAITDEIRFLVDGRIDELTEILKKRKPQKSVTG